MKPVRLAKSHNRAPASAKILEWLPLLSVFLLAVTLLAWAMSLRYRAAACWTDQTRRRDWHAAIVLGKVKINHFSEDADDTPLPMNSGWTYDWAPVDHNDRISLDEYSKFHFAGIGYFVWYLHRAVERAVDIPLWPLALAFSLVPLIRMHRRMRVRRRSAGGLCHQCGYDLRYSEENCPECGTAILATTLKRRKWSPSEHSIDRLRQRLRWTRWGLLGACAAIGSLCWYGGFVSGWHGNARLNAAQAEIAAAPLSRARKEQLDQSVHYWRAHVLRVDYVRLGHVPNFPELFDYNLINMSGEPIISASGSIQIFDSTGKAMGGIAVLFVARDRPYALGDGCSGRMIYKLPEAIRNALASGNFSAYFLADRVEFSDGLVRQFDAEHRDGTYIAPE